MSIYNPNRVSVHIHTHTHYIPAHTYIQTHTVQYVQTLAHIINGALVYYNLLGRRGQGGVNSLLSPNLHEMKAWRPISPEQRVLG